MKKITFLLFFILSFTMNAQFSVETPVGQIEDGDKIKTGTVEQEGADFHFSIKNEGETSIAMRLQLIDFENTDGAEVSLCLEGDCHNSVMKGEVYPQNDTGFYLIEPGAELNDQQNGFWNKKEFGISPEEDITYTLEFQEIDVESGDVLNRLRFTYIYQAPAPLIEREEEEKEEVKVHIQKTVIRDGYITIDAKEPVSVQIFNLIGTEVKSDRLQPGINEVDISNLSSQIYIVRFQNSRGLIKTRKVIVD